MLDRFISLGYAIITKRVQCERLCHRLSADAARRRQRRACRLLPVASAERNYPVHEKELLAMKYALAKFRIYLLGDRPFKVFTDHASLRTAVNSPHVSQRMARWLSFFAEYNFSVEYKPGRLNVVADALSRRPDYEPTAPAQVSVSAAAALSSSVPSSTLLDDVRAAYAHGKDVVRLMRYLSKPSPQALKSLPSTYRSSVHRYTQRYCLLFYSAVDHGLRLRIMHEYHDAPVSGHHGREKTYLTLSRDFYWPRQYKFVRKYIRACEVCQRVKPGPSLRAPLQSLPRPTECWESVSMDFIFGLPPHDGQSTVHRNNVAQEEQSVFPPPPPLRDSTGAVRWVVERLPDHHDQRDGNRTKYLVRWRGYPPSADSWEPRENLIEDVPGLVAQYDEAHPPCCCLFAAAASPRIATSRSWSLMAWASRAEMRFAHPSRT